nr:APC family permease [Novacetimonas pomaceti]
MHHHKKTGLGLVSLVALGAGSAIGVSIFSVLGPAARVAGSGLLLSLVLAAVPMMLFALCYADLARRYPVSGASYEWPRRYLHPVIGFSVAWMRIIANIGAMTVLASVLVGYLSPILECPVKPTMFVVIAGIFGLNILGVRSAAHLQTALMAVLLVVLAAFTLGGGFMVRWHAFSWMPDHGFMAVLAAVSVMVSLFMGIEAPVELGDEIRDARRTIPLAIALSVLLTALAYAAVAATSLALLGSDGLGRSQAPLADAGARIWGRFAGGVISVVAVVSILKSMNATAMIFSRMIYAMGRSGALPPWLGQIHPRFGTPHRATLVAGLFALSGLLLPSGLVFLLLAVNVPTLLKYMACSASAVRASRTDETGCGGLFRAPVMTATGTAAIILAGLLLLLSVWEDWRPAALAAAWLIVGFVWYRFFATRTGMNFPPESEIGSK